MTQVLAVSAFGDAIGVPYEFRNTSLLPGEEINLSRPGNRAAPGAWSDDTSMALCIALAAEYYDLRTPRGKDQVVTLYKHWAVHDGFGIGTQTREVLGRLPKGRFQKFSDAVHIAQQRWEKNKDDSAGNGSLMRIHPVGVLPYSDEEAVEVARAVTIATHADPLCVDASILWTMMIRHGLSSGGYLRPNAGIDFIPSTRRDLWNDYILEALVTPSYSFGTRGWWVVPSFQQALSAVHKNLGYLDRDPMRVFREILACGACDSDTICAIAGGLMGALGVTLESLPEELQALIHGQWPKLLKLSHLVDLEDAISAP